MKSIKFYYKNLIKTSGKKEIIIWKKVTGNKNILIYIIRQKEWNKNTINRISKGLA